MADTAQYTTIPLAEPGSPSATPSGFIDHHTAQPQPNVPAMPGVGSPDIRRLSSRGMTPDHEAAMMNTRPYSPLRSPPPARPINLNEPGTPSEFSTKELSSPDPGFQAGVPTLGAAAQIERSRKRLKMLFVGLFVVIVIIVAVAVPVIVTRSKSPSSSKASKSGGSASGPFNPTATSGTAGSVIRMEDGTDFVYQNSFGGDWVADPKNPFAAGGLAQSWSKRIPSSSPSAGKKRAPSEEWVWGQDIARGVNLGGWLVTEPFIVPALYEKYQGVNGITVVDEWTLCLAMGADGAKELEAHYASFITEKDFADIAAAGLNWVRIPIGFWAIETLPDEPFLVGTSWKYFLKAIQWGRKYGIRIFLDLHALPGSQNGWNHSGKAGSVNFMNGVMGIANAQRTLTYLRIITQFISQPEYRDVVGIFGVVNEILWGTIGETGVESFYNAAYDAIRGASGFGAGSGPIIALHDGFQGVAKWEGFLAGADRVAIDQHPYLAFMKDNTTPLEGLARKPCDWALATNRSSSVFGVTLGGEFSAAINDCGYWLSGIGSTPGYPDCSKWDDWAHYDQATLDGLKQVTLASMDALQNFFFWTWKIGNSTKLGTSSSPLWHYQLGLERGWIPKDPRQAIGHCASILPSAGPFNGNLPTTATGGGDGKVAASATRAFPPTTLSPSFSGTQIALLPTYTATGTVKHLFAPTFTAAPNQVVGSGWANPQDTGSAFVPVAGCSYPNQWDAVSAPLPTAQCTGA